MRVLLILCLAAVAWADVEVDRDTSLPAGVRRLRAPLRVTADGVTIDLGDAELVGADDGTPPDRYEGIGIVVEGRRNVTIVGGRLRGFKCAILIKDSHGVVVDGVDVSRNFAQRLRSTPEREAVGDWLRPHDNDEQEWRTRYGAGICLENCTASTVRGCRARRQQNGLVLDRCSECRVYDNDFSFLSGWGVALWRSSDNVVCRNSLDWCVRGYSHGVYARGQDSAGILVFEQCSRNVFYKNSATHGGDGFFLYAGEETLKRTGKGGCNDNLLLNNDFSHAVANAIEATFSRGNRFLGNRCDDSNYGVWAGYSYETRIEGNTFDGNSIAGVAIEHGEDNAILFNTFVDNPRGVWLWWDDDEGLLRTKFAAVRSCRSRGYRIARNTFYGANVAVWLADTSDARLEANDAREVTQLLVRRGTCPDVRQSATSDLVYGDVPFGDADFPGKRHAFLPADHPRGREHIRVDEWGPLDPGALAVFPRRVVAWGACRFHVLGGAEYAVEGLPAGLDVKRDGASFVVTGAEGLTEFAGTVRVGGEAFPIEGVLLGAAWTVSHWEWTEDPRREGAWARLVATPAKRVAFDQAVDFAWGGGGPPEIRADRFATRAVTRMELPAGTYELRTVSDDGVRVLVDGKTVLEDWTWHAPKETRATIELPAGVREIVVEHFEIDGHAVLRFDLRPVR